MNPVPIPDDLRAVFRTVVVGEPGMNPADEHAPAPAEYIVTPSTLYPGRPCFHALVRLDDADVARIAAGEHHLWLTLDGAEVPWALTLANPDEVTP